MAGHGWLFWHKGVFTSAKAKNSENQGEHHDIIDAVVHLRGRKLNTSKRTLWGWSPSILSRRGQEVVLAGGGFYLTLLPDGILQDSKSHMTIFYV
jgi:hypothetical protein